MSRHAPGIPLRVPFKTLSLILLAGCAPSRGPEDPAALSANEAWVQNACKAEMFDPTPWPKYEHQGIQISVPAPYRQTSTNPEYPVFVRTPRGTLIVRRHREARYDFDGFYNRVVPGQVTCVINYGGLSADVVSWHSRGEFLTAIRVAPQWIGESEQWLVALVRSRELSDATMLRHVLRTITLVPSRGGNP